MSNYYELKQSILDRLEIDCLIEKIKKLEKEIAEKDLAIKMLKKDLLNVTYETNSVR